MLKKYQGGGNSKYRPKIIEAETFLFTSTLGRNKRDFLEGGEETGLRSHADEGRELEGRRSSSFQKGC